MGSFTKKVLTDKNGWWNFVLPCDIDNDGDIDLIAGNLGLNSRLKASDDTSRYVCTSMTLMIMATKNRYLLIILDNQRNSICQ